MITIEDIYNLYQRYPVISTDTRKNTKDSLFFALKGQFFNGNEYALHALQNGSAYAIIDEKKFAVNANCIFVEDVLITLQQLANLHREKLNIPVIAITGTNGKTTTKELIHAVLSGQFNVIATTGNLNNHIGVPLTILSIKPDTQIGIIEMGANHPGEIASLCRIAKPTHGLITNIGKAHLEGFGSFDAVKKAKGELYDYLSENKGIVFIHSDNQILCNMITNQTVVRYGTAHDDFCSGKIVHAAPFLKIECVSCNTGRIQSRLIGRYNFENILSAVCIGQFFGVPPKKTVEAIEAYIPSNNRSQLVRTNRNTLFLDAYNANPTSMSASIDNFLVIEDEPKVLILGDMLELGNYSHEEHRNIVERIIPEKIEKIILVGKRFSQASMSLGIYEKILLFEGVEDLIGWIKQHPFEKKNIFIKGSRGVQLEKIVSYL